MTKILKKLLASTMPEKITDAIQSWNDDGTVTINDTALTISELKILEDYLNQEGYKWYHGTTKRNYCI